ncbi:MAG: LysR family transcriptional regulator [Lachnospiraceae bacterium]|nr:LysR family transcriptional regulator [Lachnospiraceae bacterium]
MGEEPAMTLRHLQIFVSVYQENSITRAAEKMYISQPAVSKYIREIEETYGCKLFERFSNRLVITPFGEDFYSYAARITSLYDEMNFAMESFTEEKSVLRIGSGTSVGRLFLPRVVKRFSEQHPNVQISLFSGSTKQNEARLMDNTLDFTIMEWLPDSPSIAHIPLETDQVVAVCSSEHPLAKKESVTAEELAACPLLLREPGSQNRQKINHFFSGRGLTIAPLWETSCSAILTNAAAEGMGIAFLNKRQINMLRDPRLTVLNVPDLVIERDLNVYYHRDKRVFPLMLEFLRHYQAFVAELDGDNDFEP